MVLSLAYLETFVSERFKNDPYYRAGHTHILAPAPGTQIIGLHTPEMKRIAKEIAKSNDWSYTLSLFASHCPLKGEGGLAHEERMIWGLVIDYVKCPIAERTALIDAFLPSIDNWAICDNMCCNSAWAKKADKEQLWPYLVKLMHSGKEWDIRVGAVLAMCHFLDEKDIDRTLHEINSLGLKENEPYYVRMGIAWLLQAALAKNQEKTRNFVTASSIPLDIIKLYVRKSKESLRTRSAKAL